MIEYKLIVHTFELGELKECAVKVLEESAEAFGAWQVIDKYHPTFKSAKIALEDELADAIQAICNLAARYDLDLAEAIKRCEERNHARGRC